MALLVKTGTYTGDGQATQTISGVGFQPKAVIIMATSDTSNDNSAMLKTDVMSTGASGQFLNLEKGLISTGLIQSLTSDGFVVKGLLSTGKNINGVTYYYLALGGDDCVTGTYTGDGNDNRNITGFGFQPKWVICGGRADGYPCYEKPDSTILETDSGWNFEGAKVGNRVQAIISDGFQVGTDLNASSFTYFYIGITGDNVYTFNYTGDGTDNRNITGVGFDPIAVFIGGSYAVMRTAETGDLTSRFIDGEGPKANRIQSFITDGFQLGSDSYVNQNTAARHAVCFGAGAIKNTTDFFNFI